MGFWLRLGLIYALLAGLLGGLSWLLLKDWQTGVAVFLLAANLLPIVVQKSPRLFLWWQRLKYTVLNTETTWQLSLQFRGRFDVDHLDRAIRRIIAEDPHTSEVLQATPTQALLRYRSLFTVELRARQSDAAITGFGDPDSSGEDVRSIDVNVFEQQVGFRRSKQMLEQFLIPLVEMLKETLTPESCVLALQVTFPESNPFVGMYLQQLRPELIRSYSIDFRLPSSAPGDYIRVDKDKMVVVTTGSPDRFRRSALEGLTFTSPGQ